MRRVKTHGRATAVAIGVALPAALATVATLATLGPVMLGAGSAAAAVRPVYSINRTMTSTKAPLVDAECTKPGITKPSTIILACGDGNAVLQKLTWSSWQSHSASGQGSLSQNDCTPDCADGTFHSYPVKVSLADPVPTDGRQYFVKVTLSFPKHRPNDVAKVERVTDCFAKPPASYIPKCPAALLG
jgi:hypothetical protein